MKKTLFTCFSLILLTVMINIIFAFSCRQSRSIIQKPIIFDESRIQLTKEYLYSHYGIKAKTIEIHPQIIVLHWTELGNLSDSFKAFQQSKLSHKERPDLKGDLNISAHFLIDRDGTIYQLMPETWMARHVIGLNYYAIGIENVGGVNQKADLTKQQLESNAFLICYLRKKYPHIRYVIGHNEYLNFKGTALWLEKDSNYQNKKVDPGEVFMHEIRRLITH